MPCDSLCGGKSGALSFLGSACEEDAPVLRLEDRRRAPRELMLSDTGGCSWSSSLCFGLFVLEVVCFFRRLREEACWMRLMLRLRSRRM